MDKYQLKLYTKAVESRRICHIQRDFEKKFNRKLDISVEYCYHLICYEPELIEGNWVKMSTLLSHSPFESILSIKSKFHLKPGKVIEIGPRTSVKTAACTNILSVFSSAGIEKVERVERGIRYLVPNDVDETDFFEIAGDKMTEVIYPSNVKFDDESNSIEKVFLIDVLASKQNLIDANHQLGLALDQSDLDFYYDFFVNKVKKNPTDVELFDLAQSDSEHSRHWFFRGDIWIDDSKRKESLMTTIRDTLNHSNDNSLIAFCDNSSSIRGFERVWRLRPSDPSTVSSMTTISRPYHLIYSAETHNFPTAVCPFQGATTGTGGRIRDIHATGRGAYEIAGTVGYSFGNLNIPGLLLPWEDQSFEYPTSISEPAKIAIEASNGASDYGNKFGEPVICGFARSFGQRLENGERCEYLKPIMFSGGIGAIDEDEVRKEPCAPHQKVVKIGGPVYRIGVGGGAASSVSVQGNRENQLDFAAVQRGDAEMGGKLHRVVRACAERSEGNPLMAIHDQGAGGNGNVIKELVEGCGVTVNSDTFQFGDESISLRELWTAEYQENDAALVDPSLLEVLQTIARREKCHVSVVGDVEAEQRVKLIGKSGEVAVDLDTRQLGEREKKSFKLKRVSRVLSKLKLPDGLTVRQALGRVLKLPTVASKRYLTCKVDRSVTGLVAQQQCVGPLHTPLADVAVVGLSHFDTVGGAVSLGEQPIKMLIDAEKGARMCISETIMNLIWAPITDLKDVKMSGNWMWAAKCDGEGARLVDAVGSLCDGLRQIGCAIDGGKDSLSMAVTAHGEVVKSPGTLVLSAYAPCTNITKVVNPALTASPGSKIFWIKCGGDKKKMRLGGSALAQVYSQIGDDCPDIEDFSEISKVFSIIRTLLLENNLVGTVRKPKILAGHDISDGGLVTAILEMAFAGNVSIDINIKQKNFNPIDLLFAEECGIVLEVSDSDDFIRRFENENIECHLIGFASSVYGPDAHVTIKVDDIIEVDEKLVDLREEWEFIGDKLGEFQTNAESLREAKEARANCRMINYKCDFDWFYDTSFIYHEQYFSIAPRVAIIREEGSNGDREMASAFTLAGFQTFDVTMTDILSGHTLDGYRGVAFVGGFSYADVLGSAKGWAAGVLFNEKVSKQFEKFRSRSDTFSYGVCNGCQLMAQLGWIGDEDDDENSNRPTVFLDENDCGRFESSFGPVKIENSKSIMLSGMENSILGLWSSHGEGRFTYRSSKNLPNLRKNGQICVRFCDDQGKIGTDYESEKLPYPWNPNGSVDDVAAICSRDGRHLAMMPHADRSFLTWQWAESGNVTWNTRFDQQTVALSPWIRMFRNAFNWSISQF